MGVGAVASASQGGTPLGAMMRIGADELLKLRAQAPYDTYRLLVVTDGEATDARLLESLLPDLMSRGLNVDVIGVAMTETHTLAKTCAHVRAAGDTAALTEALSAVFAETAGDTQSAQADFDLLAGLSKKRLVKLSEACPHRVMIRCRPSKKEPYKSAPRMCP